MSSSEASSSISDAEFDVSKDMENPGEETNLKRKRTSAAGKQSNASKKSSKNRLAYTDSEEEDEDEEMLTEEDKGKKKKTTGKSEPTGNLADYEYVITPEKSVASGQNINVDEDSESDLEISEDSESETQESSSQKRRSRREKADRGMIFCSCHFRNENSRNTYYVWLQRMRIHRKRGIIIEYARISLNVLLILSCFFSLEEFFTGHSKKDKNRLTSRQRAKLDDEFQVELLELPTGMGLLY
ncbi:hypothetical protein K7432_004335 [Basidiobolus ranarum]|uniref:Uncharacterized protein n=1 Tax=Basidiobolus ranarum TaxID=34480 RepID=A0ABR2W582_9FUNG